MRDCDHSDGGPRGVSDLGPGKSVDQCIRCIAHLAIEYVGKAPRRGSHVQARNRLLSERRKGQVMQRWADTTHQSFWAKYSELRSKTDRPALASCSKSRSCMGDLLSRSPHESVEP